MSFKDDISEAKSKELNYFHKSNEDFADDIIESNKNCWSCHTEIPVGKKYCEIHCDHPADEFDSFTGQCEGCGKSLNVNMMMRMPSVESKSTEAKIERSDGSMTIDGKQVIKIWESMQGWYWYAVEDQGEYTGVGADGNDIQAHAWFGYVQADFNEWGTFDSKELERAGVWTVPKSNWGWTGVMEESYASEVNGYIAYYDGQQTEIYADTSYDAQRKGIDFFNPPESKKHTVTVMIAEKDGEQVTHTFTESKASEKGETYHFMWNHKEVRSQLLAQAGLSDEHSNKEWDEIPEEDKTVLKLIMNDMFYSINESKSSEGYFVEWGYDLDYDFEEIDDIDEAKQLAKDNGGNVYLNDKLVYSVIPSIKDDPTNDKSRFIVANNLMGVEKVRTQEESKASEGFPSEGTSNYEFLWKHFDFVRSMDQDDIGCKICGYQLRPFGVYAYEDKIMGEAKNHMLKHGIGSGSYQKRSGESKASEYDCEACGGEYSNCPHCGHGMHDYEWERENGTCDSCEKSKYDESKASEISTIDRLRSWDKSEWHQKDINYGYTDSEWNMMSQEEQNRIVDKYEDEIEDKWNNMSDEEKNSYESKASEYGFDNFDSYNYNSEWEDYTGEQKMNMLESAGALASLYDTLGQGVNPDYYNIWELVRNANFTSLESKLSQNIIDDIKRQLDGGKNRMAEGFNQGLYGYVDAKCKTCGVEFDSIPDMDDHYAMYSDHVSNLDDLDNDIPNSD